MNRNSESTERDLEKLLHSTLYRFDCPSPELWHGYYWDELAADTRNALDAHLPQCDPCAAQLAQLQALMDIDDISDALYSGEYSKATVTNPAEATNIAGKVPAESLIEEVGHRLRRTAGQINYVIATLIEPPATLAPLALRSSKTSPTLTAEDTTSLTFEAGDTTLSLILQHEPDGTLRLAGQVLSMEPLEDGFVQLIADETSDAYKAQLDDAGSFFLQQIQPNSYQLTLLLGTTTIIIPRLKISNSK